MACWTRVLYSMAKWQVSSTFSGCRRTNWLHEVRRSPPICCRDRLGKTLIIISVLTPVNFHVPRTPSVCSLHILCVYSTHRLTIMINEPQAAFPIDRWGHRVAKTSAEEIRCVRIRHSIPSSGSNLEPAVNDVIPIRSNAPGVSPVPSASSLDVPTSVNMSLAIGK